MFLPCGSSGFEEARLLQETQDSRSVRQRRNRAPLQGGERTDRVGEATQLAQARFVLQDGRIGEQPLQQAGHKTIARPGRVDRLDRETGEVTYGRVPAGSVVVSGSMPSKDGSHSLYCAVIVKKVDAQTRSKTSVNDLLRGI